MSENYALQLTVLISASSSSEARDRLSCERSLGSHSSPGLPNYRMNELF